MTVRGLDTTVDRGSIAPVQPFQAHPDDQKDQHIYQRTQGFTLSHLGHPVASQIGGAAPHLEPGAKPACQPFLQTIEAHAQPLLGTEILHGQRIALSKVHGLFLQPGNHRRIGQQTHEFAQIIGRRRRHWNRFGRGFVRGGAHRRAGKRLGRNGQTGHDQQQDCDKLAHQT